MTLRTIQGFDNDGRLENGWSSTSHTAGPPRFGEQGASNASLNAYSSSRTLTLDPADTLVFGGAVKFNPGENEAPSSGYVLALRAASSEGIGVMVDSSYLVTLRSTYNSTAFLQTTDVVLTPGVWNYVELKVRVHMTEGVVELRVNGALAFSFVGRTAYSTDSPITRIVLDDPGGYVDTYWDDCYALDALGVENNDFLGDVRVAALAPTGVGDSTQWTPYYSGTENWDAAARGWPYYVESQTVGQKDLYAVADLPGTDVEIFGVQSAANIWKTDTAAREVSLVLKVDGIEEAAPVAALSTSERLMAGAVLETRPNGTPWTLEAVNGIQVGATVTS